MTINGKKTVQVAIAVLVFGEQLLLATRKSGQHQGGKLEFIGGKIEPNETPVQALMREMSEEIGLEPTKNSMIKLGRIYHDYPELSVCLHVFYINLDKNLYKKYRHCVLGKENQPIGFYKKSWAIANLDKFPSANGRILQWLSLPDAIIISLSLSDFVNEQQWLLFYCEKLPKNALFYPRLQTDNKKAIEIVQNLLKIRSDLRVVLPIELYKNKIFEKQCQKKQIFALKLNQSQLMNFLSDKTLSTNLPTNLPWLASCHDLDSIEKANEVAKNYPLIGIFVSPVKPTQTHLESQALGLSAFGELTKRANMPVIALGGLKMNDLTKIRQHGGFCVSGIRNFI